MRWRKLLRVMAIVVAGTGALAAFLLIGPDPPEPGSGVNFNRLKVGMSWSEVDAILGPKAEYQSGLVTRPGGHFIGSSNRAIAAHSNWITDGVGVVVEFDDQVRVVHWTVNDVRRQERGTLNDLWRRARWKWHHWLD
jgi:hypothetical protein